VVALHIVAVQTGTQAPFAHWPLVQPVVQALSAPPQVSWQETVALHIAPPHTVESVAPQLSVQVEGEAQVAAVQLPVVQTPDTQESPVAQALPQVPQFAVSVIVLVQVSPQRVSAH
jgi:hypothetical protein